LNFIRINVLVEQHGYYTLATLWQLGELTFSGKLGAIIPKRKEVALRVVTTILQEVEVRSHVVCRRPLGI
jgi:hypothetical protein